MPAGALFMSVLHAYIFSVLWKAQQRHEYCFFVEEVNRSVPLFNWLLLLVHLLPLDFIFYLLALLLFLLLLLLPSSSSSSSFLCSFAFARGLCVAFHSVKPLSQCPRATHRCPWSVEFDFPPNFLFYLMWWIRILVCQWPLVTWSRGTASFPIPDTGLHWKQ